MYARCTITKYPPEVTDEAIAEIISAANEKVLPVARTLPGFKGLLAFLDRESGKAMTFTLWEDEEARGATAGTAKTVRSDMDRRLGREVLDVEDYELIFEER